MALLKEDVCVKKRRFWKRVATILLSLAAANLFPSRVQAEGSLEYAVKAAYLVKFVPFMDWPADSFASPDAPLTICVVGADPFGPSLDRAAQAQRYGEHPVTIRRLAVADPSCHILFAGGDNTTVENSLRAVRNRPVVTVTDSGLNVHGIISFTVIDNHVRFDIDETTADSVSVRISSKLLDLAHTVKKGAQLQ